MGKGNNVWFMYSFASARNDGSENVPQIIMTVGAMGGHMGKPGNCVALSYTASSGNIGSSLVRGGGSGLDTGLSNDVDGMIRWSSGLGCCAHRQVPLSTATITAAESPRARIDL